MLKIYNSIPYKWSVWWSIIEIPSQFFVERLWKSQIIIIWPEEQFIESPHFMSMVWHQQIFHKARMLHDNILIKIFFPAMAKCCHIFSKPCQQGNRSWGLIAYVVSAPKVKLSEAIIFLATCFYIRPSWQNCSCCIILNLEQWHPWA